MASLKLRYCLYSNKQHLNITEIIGQLPNEYMDFVFEPGKARGKYISKDYSIEYIYNAQNITSIESICEDFYNIWNPYQGIIKKMHSDGFKSYLLFEFDLAGSDFPELTYENYFLNLLAGIQVELQFYFYT